MNLRANIPLLPELASMQQRHQPSRVTSSTGTRQTKSSDTHRPGTAPHAIKQPPTPRSISDRSLADLTMAEAPSQTPPPRSFEASALSDTDSQTVTDLLNHLRENSYDYGSHVQLLNLLHKGFLAHVHPAAKTDDQPLRDPQSHALLKELRQAREAMDSRFAVGEDLWLNWLADETFLARSGEERVSVTELFQKAVQDEPASVRTWQAFADWVFSNYASCNDLVESNQEGWTDEDKELCKELFTKEMLINVLEQAVAATQWRIDESHTLWNRYAELVQQDFPASPTTSEFERLRDMFMQRLQIPHSTSSETAQMLWPIVNRHDVDNWEAIMARVNELAGPARTQMSAREEHESTVRRAIESVDQNAVFGAFDSYLRWEAKHGHKSPNGHELRCALYERALLRLPTYTEWWLDYIDFVIGNRLTDSALPMIERATRHCPWSGDLWARRILRSDVERKSHDEIDATKHRATNSGLLAVGGMEEQLRMLQQWCTYLRRHAFRPGASEDDLDTAEVGITMALEDIQNSGKEVYGKDFQGDPLYRLETIQIKFFSEARRFTDAREIYRKLVTTHRSSFDFWTKYYVWELWLWGFERMNESNRVETSENGPHLATAVVQEALSQRNVDLPEKVVDMYLTHFQQHESAEKLQTALMEAREYSNRVARKRAREVEEAAQTAQATQDVAVEQALSVHDTASVGNKRKANDGLANGEHSKKTKTEDVPSAVTVAGTDPSASASAPVKRDREHNTVTARNLPVEVEELEIKKFFRDVGQPVSIHLVRDTAGDSATATIEFTSHDDVLSAVTRNGKELNGREVRVTPGIQNTLYVANYPPEYDQADIKKLFNSYGEIISVRFPSLKFNSRRRFCYVTFVMEDMAKAAETAMDNKMLDGKHRLVAKISDPDAKKSRGGPQAEGRELIVKNLDVQEATEATVKSFFAQYGEVISVKLLKLVNGRLTGSGFVIFDSAEAANAALAADKKPFGERILNVAQSKSNEQRAAPLDRARKTDIIVKGAASTSPEPDTNGRRGSDVSMASAPYTTDESYQTVRARKVAIFNLPDTVNDVRVQAAMEKYGPILKIQLRRDDHGAVVEFANVNDAFNVRQGVDCTALGPAVKTGDVAELLSKPKKRQNEGAGNAAGAAGGSAMRPPTFARPGQRGGRRGGLGYKRGGGFGGAKGHESGEVSSEQAGNHGASGARSNADFRAMLEKSKQPEEPAEE